MTTKKWLYLILGIIGLVVAVYGLLDWLWLSNGLINQWTGSNPISYTIMILVSICGGAICFVRALSYFVAEAFKY